MGRNSRSLGHAKTQECSDGEIQQKAGSMAKLEFIVTAAKDGSEAYYALLHADLY